MIRTLGADSRQQFGERSVWYGHVVLNKHRYDTLQLLSVLVMDHRNRLQDQLHLLQLVSAYRNMKCIKKAELVRKVVLVHKKNHTPIHTLQH